MNLSRNALICGGATVPRNQPRGKTAGSVLQNSPHPEVPPKAASKDEGGHREN